MTHETDTMREISPADQDFLADATGPIRYPLTNDYMFKAICQRDESAFRGLLASLLRLKPKDIVSIEIKNPIQPGEGIGEKDCILDIKLIMNESRIINIEMQVSRQNDWPERSLVYLCRAVSRQLKPGEPYGKLLGTIHIGILDFDLFGDSRAFHSHYQLRDAGTGHIYTGKIALDVVNLNQIEQAASGDIASGLRDWARLFKARTWEEIKMIAQQNESMKSFAFSLRELSADEKIQMQCEARERYEHDKASNFNAGVMQGVLQGVRQEQKNTQREKERAEAEKVRAEAAERRARDLEAELRRLKEELGK